MRVLALILILANLCFWFWARYVDVPESRPVVTNPVAARTPRLMLAQEHPVTGAAAQINKELTCLSVGPFSSETQSNTVANRLIKAGFTTTARREAAEVFAGYWVTLGGFAKRADAEQTLGKLKTAGITDASLLTEEGQVNTLSLGLFSEKSNAEQRRGEAVKLGLEPQIQNRMRKGEAHWLDVSLQEPGQHLDPQLLQTDDGGISRLETRPCP